MINVHPTHQLLCVLPRYPAVAQAEIPPRPIHVMYSHLATLADLYLIIVAVKDTLRSFTAKHG